MKILFFNHNMRQGGAQSVTCSLLNELCRTEEVDLCVICETKKSDLFISKLDSRVRVYSLGKKKAGLDLKILWYVWKFLFNGKKYDIVHINSYFYFYLLPVLLLHNRNCFFYTIHSLAEHENTKWDIVPLKKFCFKKHWLRLVSISDAVQESIKRFYGCEGILIYNGVKQPIVDVSVDLIGSYRITPFTKVFFHAGRISPEKNQIMLCRIFTRLIEEGEDIVLLIAGGQPDQKVLSQIESYFSDRIIFLGEQNNIPQWMAHCDAFCLPSLFEGMPMVLLEALSVGCIPICSPVGGIVNVVQDGDNGILSKSSEETDYYEAVRRFLSMTPNAIQSMKKRCLESFEPYEIHHTVEGYLNAYRKALEEKTH